MSKKIVYSVRDNLTFEYGVPLVYSTELECLRSLSSQILSDKSKYEKGLVNFDPDIQLSSSSLYAIGYFDDEKGIIEGFEPKLICVMSDIPNYYQKLLTEFH